MKVNEFDLEFEKAIRFLVKHTPMAVEGVKKAMVPHDIRVGVYLFNNNYSKDIVLAGILHDTIEFTDVNKELLVENFGEKVTKIIVANSKDRSIKDSDKRIEELVKRCCEDSYEALIVKIADTIDSFNHYTKTDNKNEIDYCIKNAQAVLKYKPESFNDDILEELESWLNKTK
jgi:(p)ppGpp synthase/HD superfamily hydrolase